MSSKIPDDLVKRYLAADSTLDEEEQLFTTENSLPPGIEAVFAADSVKASRASYPESLYIKIEDITED